VAAPVFFFFLRDDSPFYGAFTTTYSTELP
jgi:hypothetical protein